MMALNYQIACILYQIFKTILRLSVLPQKTWRENWYFINRNRITFKIKTLLSLDFLIPETMKLLGSVENKITKDKNGGNVAHQQITKVVLINCNIVNNDYKNI